MEIPIRQINFLLESCKMENTTRRNRIQIALKAFNGTFLRRIHPDTLTLSDKSHFLHYSTIIFRQSRLTIIM